MKSVEKELRTRSAGSISKNPTLKAELVARTEWLPSDAPLSERVFCFREGLSARPSCKCCDAPVSFHQGKYNTFCSRACSVSQTKDDPEVRRKISEANINNAPSRVKKLKETSFQKYGSWYFASEEWESRRPSVSGNISKDADLESLNDPTVLKSLHHDSKFTLVQMALALGVTERTISNKLEKFEIEKKRNFFSSIQETAIGLMLDEIGVKYIKGYTPSFLEGKELDFFCPKQNLAIEINGVYWHSEERRGKRYHLNKTELCEQNGIRLLQFWDFEIIKSPLIVKSMIRIKLNEALNKIPARKTEVVVLDKRAAADLLNRWHIKGASKGTALGLLFGNEVVAVATFGKTRFSKDKSKYELLRLAFKLDTAVTGGSSKLIRTIKQMIGDAPLISYADRRYSSGDVYNKTNFLFIGKTEPGFFWANSKLQTRSRLSLTKKSLGGDPNLTQHEMAKNAGWFRVFDCGNLKYLL